MRPSTGVHARFASLALALAGLATMPAARADAGDGDVQGMTPLVRLLEGLPHRLTSDGRIAYAALDTGLATYDVDVPAAPRLLGHVYLPGPALDVALDGRFAYVAGGETGLWVIDVADPARPVVAGNLATSGTRAVALAGSVALLAEGSEAGPAVFGLRTVDVSVPAVPVALGFAPLPNGALDVAIAGSTAWVGFGLDPALPGRGLAAVDVTDPSNPTVLPGGTIATSRAVNEVAILGGLAFLATSLGPTGELIVASVANPAMPQLVAAVPLGDAATGVAVQPGVVFVAARALGLLAYGISDPARPVLLGALRSARQTACVSLDGGMALVGERGSSGGAGLQVVDAANPARMSVLGGVTQAEATAVHLAGGIAYLVNRDALRILDASDPAAPVPLSVWNPADADFSALTVGGPLAALAQGDKVRLVDVADPARPLEAGAACVDEGVAVRLSLVGSTLHVVTGRGLETFDVTDPANPVALGRLAVPGWSAALAIDGSLGFLVAGDTLRVLDLRAWPALEIGSLVLAGERLLGVAVGGGRAVVGGLRDYLHAIDVTVPTAPRLRSSLPGGPGLDVRLAGDRAVVVRGKSGLQVVDVSDPSSPMEEGFLDTSGTASALAIEDAVVYLAAGASQHWGVRCDSCPACSERWPAIAANSLRLVRTGSGQTLSWEVVSGEPTFNVQRTLERRDLTELWMDQASVVGSGLGTAFLDGYAPGPGEVGYWRVFARGSCSGDSYFP